MEKINSLLSEYGESHKNVTNKLVHWICVPLIFFSIVGLIWSIPAGFLQEITGLRNPFVNWATILLILVLIYYVWLSPSLAVGMLLFSAFCLLVCHWLDIGVRLPLWAISLMIFILAWIGQFFGHKVEGKKPSFFKDIQFLLIGPAWLMHFVYKKAGLPY